VVTFVPPFNQPFDFPGGLAFSLSERKEAGRRRTGLGGLCTTLAEEGYRFCRVAYKPLPKQIAEFLLRRRIDSPARPKRIGGVTCVRLNTPVGFRKSTLDMVSRCAASGGIAVVHAHPHSASSGGPQDFRYLEVLLQRLAELRREKKIRVRLPVELAGGGVTAVDRIEEKVG
jgi:hypothetical protein